MREISTKKIEIGKHVLIDGVEYVAVAGERDGKCKECDLNHCGHCHQIPCTERIILKCVEKHPTDEQDEDTPMTNLQLAEWLAKGNGQYKHIPSNYGIVYHDYRSIEDTEGWFVADSIVIRPWGTDEWIKPTMGIYERDCGK